VTRHDPAEIADPVTRNLVKQLPKRQIEKRCDVTRTKPVSKYNGQ